MARPQKRGLDYFPTDVDIFSDRKIKALMARFGADGFTFYQYILCEIYRDEGYYLKTDDDFAEMSSSDLNMSIEKIGQMLNFLLSRSLLDGTLFQSDKVLTSHGIQMRYQKAKQSAGQKTPIEVDEKFWILSESETQSFIEVRHLDNKSGKMGSFSQNNSSYSLKNATKKSKEKESKLKKKKEEYAPSHQELIQSICETFLISKITASNDVENYLKQGFDESTIRYAIEEAQNRGKPYSYAKGILKRCLLDGKKTMTTGKPPASYDLEEFEKLGFHVPGGKYEDN